MTPARRVFVCLLQSVLHKIRLLSLYACLFVHTKAATMSPQLYEMNKCVLLDMAFAVCEAMKSHHLRFSS